MTLLLHRGGAEIDYGALRELETPPATSTHVPIEHWRVVDLVKHSLTYYGHEIVEEHHAIAEDGARYFGLLTLRSPYGQYTDTLGLRNSHDRSYPVGLTMGSRVFVCDNLAFAGDYMTVKRKHTQRLRFELPGLIANIVEPLAIKRNEQAKTFDRYQARLMDNRDADHTVMNLYRAGVLNIQRVPDVLKEWHEPSFEEFREQHNAWRLFNAVTFALSGRVAERPALTSELHRVIDDACAGFIDAEVI